MLITKVRLDQVQPHPHNIRRDVGDVSELVESFKTSGMLQPIVVAPVPAKGVRIKNANALQAYTLIAGHRRLAAAKACDWPDIDVIVREELDTEAKQIETMAIENLQRVNLTPAEEARGYQQLLDLGYTPQKIAKQTGRNLKTVKLRIGLVRLSPKAMDKLHTGQITIDQAEVLASFAKDPKAYAELEKTIGTNNFAYQVQAVKDKQAKTAKRQKLFEQLRAEGITRIDAPSGYPWNSQTQSLERLYIEPDAHKDCPGHAAIVIDHYNGPRIDYVCTDPAANGHKKESESRTVTASRPALSAQTEAEREARAAHLEQLRIAELARIDFIRQLLPHRLNAITVSAVLHAAARMLIFEVFEYGEPMSLADLLGIEITDDPELDDVAARLEVLLVNADDNRFAQLIFACLFALNDPGVHTFSEQPRRAVLSALVAAGYQLSDVEQAELDRTAPDVNDVEETRTNLGADGEPLDDDLVEDVVPVGEFADAI